MIFMIMQERVERRRHHGEGWNEEMEGGQEAEGGGGIMEIKTQSWKTTWILPGMQQAEFQDAKERH